MFPDTHLSLIARICKNPTERDWQQFFDGYYRPMCRFARHRGRLTIDDSQDVAASALAILSQGDLLARWYERQAAKLRTLLCSVILGLISNRGRTKANDEVQLSEDDLNALLNKSEPEAEGAFYAAWAIELVRHATEKVMSKLQAGGHGDQFRVLHGRICERVERQELADMLGMTVGQIDHAYRAVCDKLTKQLKSLVMQHVEVYCDRKEVQAEFEQEWLLLGDFLATYGGLDAVVQDSFEVTWNRPTAEF